MKKIFSLVFTIFLLFFFVLDSMAEENGSLKIDTNVKLDDMSKEIYYIEQDEDLLKLFHFETTKFIQQEQKKERTNIQNDKNFLFLNKYPTENLTKGYQSLLFNSDTKRINIGDYAIAINASRESISWKMYFIAGLGFLVTMYSVVRLVIMRKGRNY